MQQTIKRFCTYMLAGMLSIFGASAFAAPLEALRYIVVDAISAGQGAESARFIAEQALMASANATMVSGARSDLRRDGHGYRLASAEEQSTDLATS